MKRKRIKQKGMIKLQNSTKKSWFSKHGITARIVLLFITLVIVPFFVMAAVVIHLFQDYSITSLGNAAADAMSAVGFQISGEVRSRKESSMIVYYNDIVKLLSDEEADEKEKSMIMEKSLTSSVYSTNGVIGAAVIDREGNVYGVGSYLSTISFMVPHKEEVLSAGGKCCWYVTNEIYGKADENKYILARSLNNKEREHVGFLYMVMGDSLVRDAFEQLQSDDSTRYLTDENGKILYSSEKDRLSDYLDISALDRYKTTDYQKVKLEDGSEVIMASRKIWDTGWYCISVIELSHITKKALNLMKPFLVIAVIYIVFLLVMLYMLRRYVFQPLSTLKKAMDQYAQGELHTVEMEPVGVGELRSLSGHFNNMMLRIDNLISNYRQEVEEKNRQKLLVLTSQLTPHFIYNALNTIKWVAVLNHQENIQKLIESLIYVFMSAARDDEKGYCVEDELKLVENYTVIQKARFMNFELVIECEEECRGFGIRKFLLQPMVENAVVHGLGRGKIKNTEIRVKVWADENLHITVEDKGIGFDVVKWRNSPEKKEGHTNIGIRNVEEMIRMEYGEPYGMWIESRPGEGTKVSYLLPAIRRGKNDSDHYC